MNAKIDEKAPNFVVSGWVQGAPTNFDREIGNIVLLEVFQVNCPGCFMHAIPEAVRIHEKYKGEGVKVLGLATAFEDFDKNTLDNLKLLAQTGEVIGETKDALSSYGQLQDGDKISYKIPFPLAMDNLTRTSGEITQDKIMEFVYPQIPEFDSQPQEYKNQIIEKAKNYMESKIFSAETFEKFSLQGTPSMILVDRKGILRDVSLGQAGKALALVQKLLDED